MTYIRTKTVTEADGAAAIHPVPPHVGVPEQLLRFHVLSSHHSPSHPDAAVDGGTRTELAAFEQRSVHANGDEESPGVVRSRREAARTASSSRARAQLGGGESLMKGRDDRNPRRLTEHG